MNMIPNETEAGAIYDILVNVCGAHCDERERENFVQSVGSPHFTEWRFQGTLGFGGKFWNNASRWYVNCHQEDETPARQLTIDKANVALATLRTAASADFQAMIEPSLIK
jgi:hypothetical protein